HRAARHVHRPDRRHQVPDSLVSPRIAQELEELAAANHDLFVKAISFGATRGRPAASPADRLSHSDERDHAGARFALDRSQARLGTDAFEPLWIKAQLTVTTQSLTPAAVDAFVHEIVDGDRALGILEEARQNARVFASDGNETRLLT